MTRAGSMVAEVLEALKMTVKAGMTTRDIESFVDGRITALGGRAAFKGYRGYPSSVCVSVNEQVVHGIPSVRKLNDGDIVSIDIGVYVDGFYGDAAITLPIGTVDAGSSELIKVTEEALYLGIENAVPGKRLYDISSAIQRHVEAHGFSVVRLFVGHGIGRQLHEDPQIPNFGSPGQGPRLQKGMTLAIEPMVNAGTHEVRILDDGWTAVTADGQRSAHFEHTVLVTDKKARILTKCE